ncbi:MAG: conjugal transfer protein TraN [Proteobacteria bacterium]|nr:conjugal transfer protein TraN [Pseudomonadota bacterium]
MRYIIAIIMIFTSMQSFAGACTKISEVCTDNSTRVINGFAVTRCWNYRSTYSCPSDDYQDHCTALDSVAGCNQVNSVCISVSADGKCEEYEKTYICGDQVLTNSQIIYVGDEYTIATDTLDNSQCQAIEDNPHCTIASQTCVEGPETRNIDGLDVYKDCWSYEYTYNCKTNVKYDNCDDLETNCSYLDKECIFTDDNGLCTNYERSYRCSIDTGNTTPTTMSCAEQTYCINGDCADITYPPDTGMAEGLAYMNLLKEAGKDFDADNLSVFEGKGQSCDKTVAGFNNCCTDDGWGQDISLAACDHQEKELAIKEQAGQCHYIGTYCSDKSFLGVCLKKRKSYCCFGSKLARIIHEQARGQLSMNWGSPQAPNCESMTIDQLQSIDFTQVDLSELYPDILGNISIPAQGTVVNDLTNKIQDYYAQ